MNSTNPTGNIWENPKKRPWLIAGAVLAVVIIIITICKACTTTVAEYRETTRQRINYELSSSNHKLRQRVEAAHVTVTVYSAYMSDLQIQTKDGSDNAGSDGSNIQHMHMEITARWNGAIHKGGKTVIGIDFENINGKFEVTSSKIIKTDALVNTEDPNFWYEVGAAAAVLLL
ncbi:MAG: hypothetical protein J5806_13470 [Lentisphaeria bacterium]|nr:hypothetical protein [Lentisphaeria bacterium]